MAGDPVYLEDYERARLVGNVGVMGVCDGLNRLFSTAVAPVVAARALGLAAVDAAPWLKVSAPFLFPSPFLLSSMYLQNIIIAQASKA